MLLGDCFMGIHIQVGLLWCGCCDCIATKGSQPTIGFQHVQQKGVIKELERCFLVDDLMNEIGIIYFQYWEALDAKMTFSRSLGNTKS